jgi:C-terminal processing protease CtpA/Prc
LEKSKKEQSATPLQNLGRTFTKNGTKKLVAVLLTILAIVLGFTTILHRGATVAYAIEQTVEAIGNVSVVHILGRDWDDKQVEIWGKVNPDTGLMDYWHVKHIDDGRVLVSTPQNTFSYDERANTVRIQDGPSLTSIFHLGEFFQGMERLAEVLDGKITYCTVTDARTKKNLIELKMSASETEIVSLIEANTKLPLSINATRGERFGSSDVLKHAIEIRYADSLPEGLFDFTIPAGANISVETSEDPLQNLPLSVLAYCAEFHMKTAGDLAKARDIPVNTRLYYVDDQFNLRDGGFLGVYNDSNKVWTGEISVGNMDLPHIALFDTAGGKKQQIRLVQHKQFPPGRFRLYWTLEQPVHPGQTRYGIYWVSEAKKLPRQSANSAYQLAMSNTFGREAIENFILIVPADLEVCKCSSKYLSHENINGYDIYIWQKNLPKHRIDNIVDVSLAYCHANYTADYIEKNQGKVLIEIPEVFELANIAIAISDEGLNNPNRINKRGAYYKRVLEHFKPFKDHPLIKKPDLNYNYTYTFRDNSICYVFEGDRIVHGGLYSNMRRPDLFKKHLALVEDFARVSNFRKFYRDNLPYYQQQIKLYRQKVPVRKMWTWLEERFPSRHDCYKVVFSPLIGASHETCSFKNRGFSETIMFISGPGEPQDFAGAVGEGLLSRVVFTEIDHNYVNRVTKQHTNRVNKAFADLDAWNQQGGYRRPEYTFNEYMTWAVFVLYAYDNYEKQDAETIVKRSPVNTMVHHRKFVRFREFADQLLKLYRNRAQGQSIPDLYPGILAWAEDYEHHQRKQLADAIDSYEKALKSEPNSVTIHLKLADLYRQQGNEAESRKHYNATGFLDDDAWMIIGPFDNTDGNGFNSEYPPEKGMDLAREYPGKEGNVKWFRPKRGRIDGIVDLAALLGRVNWAVAYAATSVQSPETREVQLRIGSDDDVKVWLNSELVLSRNVDRPAVPDEDIVPVTLQKGQNQLLLKVCNRLYSWGFYARITDVNEPRYGAAPPVPRITREQAIDDVDFLVEQLKAKHPRPFAKISEQDFSDEVGRLKAALSKEVLVKDFSLSIAALLALIRDDHTRHRDFSAFNQYVNSSGKVFPVKFRYKDDHMAVEVWAPQVSPARLKVGDTVVAVNGDAMESLLQRYGQYISLETDLQRCWMLEWSFDRYQVMLGDIGSEYTLQLRDSGGKTYSETLPAVKPWREQYEKSKPKAPRFHHQFYEDGKVCLFKLQTFNWDLRAELESKLTVLLDAMRQNKTEIVILDLRGNGGGNSTMGSIVLTTMIDGPYGELRPHPDQWWPVRLALLCDRATYSAASFEAMLVKDYGAGIIAGEETGGRASGYGNIEHVTFPNSLLSCGIATGYFPRRACYDDGRGVLPDLPLDVTLEDSVLVESISDHVRKLKREAMQSEANAFRTHLRLAMMQKRQGNEQEALKHYNATGFIRNREWRIIGPFDNKDGLGFEKRYPPEKEIDFTSEYAGKSTEVKWLRPENEPMDGFVDLVSLLGRADWAVAYAATCVQSPDERQVQLRIGSDDGVKVWLNGELVLSRNIDRAAALDQDIIPATLRKGRNQLLLKICNRLYSWSFYMRITDPAGKPYDDLRFLPWNSEVLSDQKLR